MIVQQSVVQHGLELKKVLDAYKFAEWANQVPGLEKFGDFQTTLDNIVTMFGQCEACRGGGGNPMCTIRVCCREKKYQTCAECETFPCDKINVILDNYPPVKDNLLKIKSVGLEKWSRYSQICGFGQKTGIDIPDEAKGLVPTLEYLHRRYGKGEWVKNLVINFSIRKNFNF